MHQHDQALGLLGVIEASSLLNYMRGASDVLLPLRSMRSPLEVFDLLLGRVLQARPFFLRAESDEAADWRL